MALTLGQKFINLGMPSPLAKEFADQLVSNTFNWRRLMWLSMVPELAKYLAESLAAGSYSPARAMQLGMVGPLANLTADVTSTVSHLELVPEYGQSWPIGLTDVGSPLVNATSIYPDEVMTFGNTAYNDIRMGIDPALATVLDPATLTTFIPLVAKYPTGGSGRGETPVEAMLNKLARLARSRGERKRFLGYSAGVGGATYDELKLGTQPWLNLVAATTKGVALATSRGWTSSLRCLLWYHGNSEDVNYRANMLELSTNVNAVLKPLTGQSENIIILFVQPSSWGSAQAGPNVKIMDDLAREFPLQFRVVTPDHPFPWAADFLHKLGGPGYSEVGKRAASAWDNLVFGDGQWTGVRVTDIVRSGNIINATVLTPTGPAQLVDVGVANYGFQYLDDNLADGTPLNSVSITSVELVGSNNLRITLSGIPTGKNRRLNYALVGQTNPRTEAAIPRGGLCDSDEDANWCAHFSYSFGLGENLNPNSTFDVLTPWTQGTGSATATGGKLVTNRAGGAQGRGVLQLPSLAATEIGETYAFTADFERTVISGAMVLANSASSSSGAQSTTVSVTANGVTTYPVISQQQHWLFLQTLTGSDGQGCAWDNVSFRKLL